MDTTDPASVTDMTDRTHTDRQINQACITACHELPEGTHPDDMLDAVWQQLPAMTLTDEAYAADYLRRIR